MKISALQMNKLSFCAYPQKLKNFEEEDDLRHLADDWQSEDRDILRDHYYSQILPGYDFNSKKNNLYAETINDVYIPNKEKIGNGSYKGASLVNNIQYIDLLRNSQINTIIDLVGFDKLKNACKDKNIEYYRYEVGDRYWANPIFSDNKSLEIQKLNELYSYDLPQEQLDKEFGDFKSGFKQERKEFMNKFIELVNVINEGHFYIGCEFGSMRTPNVLALATWFNPKWLPRKILPTDSTFFDKMRNMYNNLSDEDKQKLEFTPEYDNRLKSWLFNK